MENGFIVLHRKIKDWQWYSDNNTKSLFIHLILFANHENKTWLNETIKRGQIVIGRKSLSETLGISEQSLRTSFTKLKSTNEITIKSTNKYSIITILKYNEYQLNKEKSTTYLTSKSTNEQPTTNQQLTTNNNITIKQLNNINIAFDIFWELYDKKIDRPKCESKWSKLKDEERKSIIDYLPKYKSSLSDKQYQKHPATFLNNRSWENEITTPFNERKLSDGTIAVLKDGEWKDKKSNVRLNTSFYGKELK